MVTRIISGGQTGADRGGLDAAIAIGISHGGCCPSGRRAEDGRIPALYRLRELTSPHYVARTEANVVDSDGTLVVTHGSPSGGSALTCRLARHHGRPLLWLDLDVWLLDDAAAELRRWIDIHQISTLNVAGSRESACIGLSEAVKKLVMLALARH